MKYSRTSAKTKPSFRITFTLSNTQLFFSAGEHLSLPTPRPPSLPHQSCLIQSSFLLTNAPSCLPTPGHLPSQHPFSPTPLSFCQHPAFVPHNIDTSPLSTPISLPSSQHTTLFLHNTHASQSTVYLSPNTHSPSIRRRLTFSCMSSPVWASTAKEASEGVRPSTPSPARE